MAHPHLGDIQRTHGDKLEAMTGKRGMHASERADHLVEDYKNKDDATHTNRTHDYQEQFVAAPPRQVSNFGRIKE